MAVIIQPPKHSRKRRKRVARGESSGWGCTAGRGNKGQRSRSGSMPYVGHEGGRLPLYRKISKSRGFSSLLDQQLPRVALTLQQLDHYFKTSGLTVDIAALRQVQAMPAWAKRVKIIAKGKLTKALHLKGLAISKSASQAVQSLGGSVQ